MAKGRTRFGGLRQPPTTPVSLSFHKNRAALLGRWYGEYDGTYTIIDGDNLDCIDAYNMQPICWEVRDMRLQDVHCSTARYYYKDKGRG